MIAITPNSHSKKGIKMANGIVCAVSIRDKKKVYYYTILATSLDQAMAFVRQRHPKAIGYSGQITMTAFYDLVSKKG